VILHPLLDHPALRHIREDVTLLDAEGRIVETTMGLEQTIGYARDVWEGTPFFDFLDPRDVVEIRRTWREFVDAPGASRRCEVRFRTADGLPNVVELDLANHLDDPALGAVLAVGRNITHLRAAEELVTQQHDIIDKIGRGHTDEALGDLADLLMSQIGRARVAIASYLDNGSLRVEIGRGLGSSTIELMMEEHATGGAEDGTASLVVVEHAVDPRSHRPVGAVLVVLDERRPLLDHERRALQGVAKFTANLITQRRHHERLAYEAQHDDITGAVNRATLTERVQQALRRRDCSIALLLIDIDRFQMVNDSYGHAVGDHLLRAFASRIGSFLEPDDLLARFGGDEFVILIVQRHATDAAEVVAERVDRALGNPFAVDGYELHVSAGIGIARTHSGDCDSFDQLMAEADAALAESKQRGRGETTVFTPEIQDRLITRLQNENELRRALRNDELVLHYQPKFDLRTNKVVGVEALARWIHPRDGLLTPAAFVPLAEEAGLIETLGGWVLRQAVQQAATWLAAGDIHHPFAISVNVSAGQLAAGDFAGDVQSVVNHWAWPVECLVIELTETSLMADCDHARGQLARLEEIGVKIAIDDFGTGYSSLSYLHRFPVEIVKLDRSFVAAIGTSHQALAVPRAVATMAESLGLTSVAEGIETAQQLDAVRSLGFDWGQGFLLSPPLDAAECAAVLRENGTR
jgi:diguanylate cyclase (GGDEF)-like protein/PAS domain S-box-containing protein